MSIKYDQAIALAGMFQATSLVRDIAHQGRCENDSYITCIESLFTIDADSTTDVYGQLPNLAPGLRTLICQLRQPADVEITRYVLSLMVLEKKLGKQREMLTKVRQGIEQTQRLMQHFSLDHEDITARLADLYTNTISTLRPRIMVNGDYEHLKLEDNANRIRALLLAGIRSAVLWRQKGGGRTTLLFGRKALTATAESLLEQIQEPDSTISHD